MMLLDSSPSAPFEVNDWLINAHNPAQQGQLTCRTSMAGPKVMVEVRYPDGALKRRPMEALSSAKTLVGGSIPEKLLAGQFRRVRDLQRLITFEKLRGTLHEVV